MTKRRDKHTAQLFDDGPRLEEDPSNLDEIEYTVDPSDGMLAEVLKSHSSDKHSLIKKYVDICRATRRNWIDRGASAAYIDLFCGPGRACNSNRSEFFDAGPLVAWNSAQHPSKGIAAPFSNVFIADKRADLAEAAANRLRSRCAPVLHFVGEAETTVSEIVRQLRTGLHLAVLDPFGIKHLPFSIVDTLAQVNNLDLFIHVSALGLRRNLGFNVTGEHQNFDRFCPKWRSVYDDRATNDENVRQIFGQWAKSINGHGKQVHGTETISSNGRTLYWLVLISGHPLAGKFWDSIIASRPQRALL